MIQLLQSSRLIDSNSIRQLQTKRQPANITILVGFASSLSKSLVNIFVHIVPVHFFDGQFLCFILHFVVGERCVARKACSLIVSRWTVDYHDK